MKTYFNYLCYKFTGMEEKDYNSFGFKNSFIDKYNKSNQNIKNMVNKKISINETFGVDPIVVSEKKDQARRKENYLRNKTRFISPTTPKNADKDFVDYNFKIGNQGDVSMTFRKGSEKKRKFLSELQETGDGKGRSTLYIQPSFTKRGKEQKIDMDTTKNYGGQKTSKRQFGYAQEFKDRIVKKQFVRDAMKSIYGDPKNNLINKYGKK